MRFSLWRPRVAEKVDKQQAVQIKNRPKKRQVSFEVGEKVRVRDYGKNSSEWSKAIVTESKTLVTHVVRMSGGTCKRRSNQIRKCSQKTSEFQPPVTGGDNEKTNVPRRSKRLAAKAKTPKKGVKTIESHIREIES